MFEARRTQSTFGLAMNMLELSFVAAARKVRQSHRNAIWAIMLSMFQSVLFIFAFYLMFTVVGARGAAIRGDFLLYLLTGIYAYLTHIKSVQQVMSAEGRTSAIMQHAPMNTLVAIFSSAMSVLYTQTICLLIILFAIHTAINPISIHFWHGRRDARPG